MNRAEAAHIALRALRANLLRSMLTILGIVIGVAAVITMVAIGGGAQEQVARQIRSLGANLLVVHPGTGRQGAVRLGAGSRATLTENDAAAIVTDIPGVVVAAPAVSGQAHIVYGNRNWSTLIGGVAPDYLVARDWRIEEGQAFSREEADNAEKVALLGATVAQELFADEKPLGRMIRIGNVAFRVVGVLARKGQNDASGRDQDDVVLIPLAAAKLRVLGASQVSRGAVHFILVKAISPAAVAPLKSAIRELLRQHHRLPDSRDDDFQLQEPAAAMQAHAEATRSLTFLLAAIASVSLLVGGISIMNILLVSIAERTREIGLRRALGARKRDIQRQFLVEAVLLCALGGIVGILVGVASASVLARLAGWPVLISVEAILIAFGSAVIVGMIFGYYPARKASRLDPIEALRFA
jgi:putative ABC transport system permease protein